MDPMVALQAPLSMGCSRQEYWSGLPCPSPGDVPNSRIKLAFFMSPASSGGFFTTSTTWGAPLKNGPHQNSNNNKSLLKNAFGKSHSFLMPHCIHWKHCFKVLIYVSGQWLYMAQNSKISKQKLNSTNWRGAVMTCLYSRFMCFLKWSEVARSCPTLCEPMDCSLLWLFCPWDSPGKRVEWVTISFSKGSSWSRDQTQVPHTVGRRFTVWATKPPVILNRSAFSSDGITSELLWMFFPLDTGWLSYPTDLAADPCTHSFSLINTANIHRLGICISIRCRCCQISQIVQGAS